MKILMVLTSHDKLGNTGRKTGFWLEEFAAPYYVFKDAGAEIVLASPKGGQPPLDPKSNEPNFQTELTRRFEADAAAKAQLASTVRLDSVKAAGFRHRLLSRRPRPDVGPGRGPELDRADRGLPRRRQARRRWSAMRPACSATSRRRTASRWWRARQVTGFTNTEEEAVELTKVVPFLVEDELKANGGHLFQDRGLGSPTSSPTAC